METSPLLDWVKATPFIPFTVTLSNGQVVSITKLEMMILGRRIDTVSFVDEDGLDRWFLIHHDHIASIDAYDPVQSQSPPA